MYMKTYKLIKEYPGSPSLGTIVEALPNVSCYSIHCNIEKFPAYWEEIKEKEYEILTLIANGKHPSRIKGYISTFNNKNNYDFYKHYWDINSIIRLSDREIFTVGDNVEHKDDNDKGVITKIKILENPPFDTIVIEYKGEYKGVKAFIFSNSIGVLKHSKPPLFISEDNVPIYEGDEYWWLHLPLTGNIYSGNAGCVQANDTLRFSTKKAAEDYIAKNKVLFVTEDGVNAYSTSEIWCVNIDSWRLNGTADLKNNMAQHPNVPHYRYLSTKEKAQEYIDKNKPMYSKNQIKDAWNESREYLDKDISLLILLKIMDYNK